MLGLGLGLVDLAARRRPAAAVVAANNVVSVFGNSLTQQAYTQSGSPDWRAYPSWLNLLANGSYYIPREQVFGRSGQTSAQIDAMFADLLASPAGTVVVHPITNDARNDSGDLATIAARYQSWRDQLRAAGKVQIWANGSPRSDDEAAQVYSQDKLHALRAIVDALHNPAIGCTVANTMDAGTTVAGGRTPLPGFLRTDLLHYAPTGAQRTAAALDAAIKVCLPAFPFTARPGLVLPISQGFTGGGANSPPASGGAAGGTWGMGTLPAGVTYAMRDEDGIRWLDVSIATPAPAAGAALGLLFTGPAHASLVGAAATFVPGVTRVASSMLVRVQAGSSGLRGVRHFVYDSGGQTLPYSIQSGSSASTQTNVGPSISNVDGGTADLTPLPSVEIRGVLRTWGGVLRANANRVMPMLGINGVKDAPVSAVISFALPQIEIEPA